ncbi:unnamed protein product [Albugo candida]|nr:unnamed protein product [Albugo candida]|eukprot:CCI39902.1 unnamed protein product [Albugo candida]
MPFSGEEAENDFIVTQSTTLKHRQGITGTLLHEIKVLSEKNEAMEKRLMELEADTNSVRNDHHKLWKHVDATHGKQCLMQEKMRAIMWNLYTDYRKTQSSIANCGPQMLTDEYQNTMSIVGSSDFRDVMRYLAMDDASMLIPVTLKKGESSPINSRNRGFSQVCDGSKDDLYLADHTHKQNDMNVSTKTSYTMNDSTTETAFIHTMSHQFSTMDPSQFYQKERYSNTVSMPPLMTTFAHQDTQSPRNASSPAFHEEFHASNLEVLELTHRNLPNIFNSDSDSCGLFFAKLETHASPLLAECDVGCLDTLLQSDNEKDFMMSTFSEESVLTT